MSTVDYVDYVFCLTGDPSSRVQAMREEEVRANLASMGKRVMMLAANSCNIYVARNGVMRRQGFKKHQKPFEGLIGDYDRMIWIDSDNIITTDQVLRLINHNVDIVAGWYRQSPRHADDLSGNNKAVCGYWAGAEKHHGNAILVNQMPSYPTDENGLIPVDYVGLGLMVVKKGVFEAMSYPWFSTRVVEWTEEIDGELVEMADIEMDDGAFCRKAQEAGFQVYVDPEVFIGHEKMVVV